MNQSAIYDLITAQFLICEEMKPNKGEDSGVTAIGNGNGIICALDGCGGLGAMTYPQTGTKTGAYIASRTVANAVLKWFRDPEQNALYCRWNTLKSCIDESMKTCGEKIGPPALKLKGSMARSFPTTIAAVAYEKLDNIVTTHIWAGDSRTYLLTEQGLAQVSEDDVSGEDALSNLSNDGILTNVISENKPYELHGKTVELEGSGIMLVATDGCFGYLTSPMRFEEMLLDCLLNADNIAVWQEKLRMKMATVAEDDFTLAVSAVNYESFAAMQNAFRDRYAYVAQLAKEFDCATSDRKQALWDEYKADYYRYQSKG